jgi:hypothetical protein
MNTNEGKFGLVRVAPEEIPQLSSEQWKYYAVTSEHTLFESASTILHL